MVKAVLRNIGAVLVGVIVGMVVNMGLVQVNSALFPPPEGMTLVTMEDYKALIPLMGAPSWLLVFAAHLGQAFVGGFIAALLAASRPMGLALFLGAFSMAGGIANALMLDIPA
jgi:hypothetical protein